MEQVLSVSRMVHVVMPNGEHRPAVCVKVHNPTAGNFQVFTDAPDNMPNVSLRQSVAYAEPAENSPWTWHWPERVDAAPPAPAPTEQAEQTAAV